MSRIMKKNWVWAVIGLGVAVCLLMDILPTDHNQMTRAFLPKGVVASPGVTSMVAIVGSDDAELSSPAPLTVSEEYANDPHSDTAARLNTEQIEEMVYRALNLDTSERSIREVVQPGDWVVVKPNIVTCPDGVYVRTAWGQRSWSHDNNRDQDHWGQTTDTRVVRAVVKYLIQEEGDASRITIAEGGGEWKKVGESNNYASETVDGWTAQWPPFDNLSFMDILDEFQDNGAGIEVDIVDLNYDDYVDEDGVSYPWTNHSPGGAPIPVPDPNGTGVGWFQREQGHYVSKTLLDCDKLINIPAMKTHDIPGVTAIFKQYVGTYMQNAYGDNGSSKMGLHDYGNDKVPLGFMDLFCYRPTDYSVVEGIWGVEGAGPQTGDDVKLNVIVAGGDPAATEAVTAQIMGFNPYDLYHLHLAAAKGFGTWDMNQIQVVGRSIDEVRRPFDKPSSVAAGPMGITRWLVNGPYDGDSIEIDYLDGEADVLPAEGDIHNGNTWQLSQCELRDQSTLNLSQEANQVSYAFCWVECEQEMTVTMQGTSNDRMKVWLNGEPVYTYGLQSINKQITLQAGHNSLLVKVLNTGGDSSLELILTDDDDNTPLATQYLVALPETAVEETDQPEVTSFKLSQNYPNPFNASTWISFQLADRGHVRLTVYNTAGQKVRTILDKELLAGIPYNTFWNGKDEQGQDVASGIYLCRLNTGSLHKAIKMTLLR